MSKPLTMRRENPSEDFQEDQDTSFPDLGSLTAELAAFLNPNAPLSKNEMKSVTAMIAYVAHTQNVGEETVSSILSVAFGVSDVNSLQGKHYDAAIHYLVDLQLDEVMN
ncbi:MAG: hypothetical protein PHY92_07980 [Alphaproteobacteria bacterium]|nr:hypothetical protein [Alphaproteobacteria bacterium]